MPIKLSDSLTVLPKIGKTTASYLQKLDLNTVLDLLFYFPNRYQDLSKKSSIASLTLGELVNVQGEIILIQARRSYSRRLSLTEALVKDESGTVKVVWFNQPFITRSLKMGDKVSLTGKVSSYQGQIMLASPTYEKITSHPLIQTTGIISNYPLTNKISQKQLRFYVNLILPLARQVPDWLPLELRKKLKLADLSSSIINLHQPQSLALLQTAKTRQVYSDLFFKQLKSQLIKRDLAKLQAPVIEFRETETKRLVKALPFTLTDDQKKTAWEILQDLAKPQAMSRLLQGDVGSGKTIVAALALYNCVLNKKKAVLMAPTEILAQQHYQTLTKLFAQEKTKLSLITKNNKAKIDPEADIYIGTQALIYQKIKLPQVALAIVDEQHRFGVRQRQSIASFNQANGLIPHFLSMTATPIPRTLSLAIYGDLDLSLIKTLPPHRLTVETKLASEKERKEVYQFVRDQVKSGRQAFIICPLVNESDKLEVKSAKAEYDRLAKKVFPELKLGLLHGQLKGPAKEKIMADLVTKKIDVLVTTSIIELGLDVSNASVIIIEGAERFGLAQLHQFRGRVGRSQYQSYCFLFLSEEELSSEKSKERLKALENHHQGQELAKIDLKLRGAGDLFGKAQSGFSEIDLATLFPLSFIKQSEQEIQALLEKDPNLKTQPGIKKKLANWESLTHLE